ncbi:N-acetylglucosamine kinase [Oceanobacillus sp. CFH 90083]|uniref:N-acetylglucosamine kinase n=1 Tax=Oceanobacillus sp. CFH 90083 TaxID=2592336 RepID=UPI00128DD01A|nr:BadF/BadG/BcrA/BcrD ATPase family protein [Oceanobacillus sp. CFH 90083]
MYILGMDGGGTKTKALLFHKTKGIVWETEAAAANPHSTSYTHSVKVVSQIIDEAYDDMHLPADTDLSLGLGIAGLGRKADQKIWLECFRKISSHGDSVNEIIVENDGIIALYSETFGADGIVSICGTGAISLGIHRSKTGRVGGWGHVIGGDPGSGYDLGLQALIAVFNELDGLGPKTAMTNLILSGEGIHRIEELIPVVYQNFEKLRVAAFAAYVFQAADLKDAIAINIIQETAEKIAHRGNVLFERLFQTTEKPVSFVLAGGVFQNDLIVTRVMNELAENSNLNVMLSKNPPVIGSIVLVLKKQGHLPDEIKKMLVNTGRRGE